MDKVSHPTDPMSRPTDHVRHPMDRTRHPMDTMRHPMAFLRENDLHPTRYRPKCPNSGQQKDAAKGRASPETARNGARRRAWGSAGSEAMKGDRRR